MARATSYYELTKPGIAAFVTMLAGVSYIVAARGRFDVLPLVNTLVGTASATAGALALNQYAEREVDALMLRTRSRPLPSGRMAPREALGFGTLLLALGVGYLAATVGWLPSALTALSAAAYLLAYTPLKSRSYLATLVGAFPGAFPALIGWTAATGRVQIGGVVLFGIAFLWQLPHVLALAWLLREDYARVGFFLTPPTDDGLRIGRHMVYHSVSLLGLSAFPTLIGMTGRWYLVGALALGGVMLGLAIAAASSMTRQRARRVFLYSLLYQPLLMGLLLLYTVRG
ncbi:MAG: protoheme IX farnesyltransferase [Gemmatimonadetes bacterium]|nr:protoheme IX farnesyltransferase [Gemmatimonadota bacterium]